jgi:hypothetical protein
MSGSEAPPDTKSQEDGQMVEDDDELLTLSPDVTPKDASLNEASKISDLKSVHLSEMTKLRVRKGLRGKFCSK